MSDLRYVRERILLPIALPVGAMLALAILAYSFAQILLAVNKQTAPIIAIAAAAEILIVGVLVSVRKTSKPIHGPVIALLLVAMVVVGFGTAKLAGSAHGEGEAAGGEGTVETGVEGGAAGGVSAIKIVAKGIQFTSNELALPANAEAKIELDNADPGTPHNVSIYTNESATTTIFKGALITGPKKTTYTVKTPAAGTYYFHCDVHPNMNGTVKVA